MTPRHQNDRTEGSWTETPIRDPTGPKIDCAGYRIIHDKVGTGGTVALRHARRLHHIGIGVAVKGWRIVMLIAGLEIRILSLDGTELRRLTIDPAKDYQPLGRDVS